MKKKIFALVTALAVCCLVLLIGGTYALYEETISTRNHLAAGTLTASLVRQKLTSVTLGSNGYLETTVDDTDKDFTADTSENIFDVSAEKSVAPGSSFTVDMAIKNNGNVAFYYYVEVYFNSVISDETFASMLKLSVETEKNVKRETFIKDGLTLGEDEFGLGTVEVGGTENFTVKLEFVDSANNNKAEGKFVQFDLRVHAVQKIDAE